MCHPTGRSGGAESGKGEPRGSSPSHTTVRTGLCTRRFDGVKRHGQQRRMRDRPLLACIVYWQAREISRLAAVPDFPFDPDLLRHVSPIEWKNVGGGCSG